MACECVEEKVGRDMNAIGWASLHARRSLSDCVRNARSSGQGRTRLRAWMLLRSRSLTGCHAWMRRGELKLALTMRGRPGHRLCPIPLHLRLLLLEKYTLRHHPLLPLQLHLPPTITIKKTAQSHLISLPPLVGSSPSVSTCDASAQRRVGALRSSIQRG